MLKLKTAKPRALLQKLLQKWRIATREVTWRRNFSILSKIRVISTSRIFRIFHVSTTNYAHCQPIRIAVLSCILHSSAYVTRDHKLSPLEFHPWKFLESDGKIVRAIATALATNCVLVFCFLPQREGNVAKGVNERERERGRESQNRERQ